MENILLASLLANAEVEGVRQSKAGAVVPDTGSTSVASFVPDDTVKNLNSVIVDIEPVQSGSGDPSPTNVRPISGHTEVKVYKRGVNLWDEEWEVGALINGEPASTTSSIRSANYCPIKPETTYYVVSPAPIYFHYYDSDKTFVSRSSSIANGTITTPENVYFFKISGTSNYGATYNSDISVNYPSTDTSYHAYSSASQDITISLGQTVYGGTVDVTTGVLTIDHFFCTPDNATRIRFGNNGTINYAFLKLPYTAVGANLTNLTKCSMYHSVAASNVDKTVRMYQTEADIYDSDLDITSEETVRAYLSDCMIVYPLYTPITVQLTPTEIAAISGQQNNLWADTGDVSVQYAVDLESYISNTQLLTNSLIAKVLTELKADANLVANDFRIYNNTLYRITANIASGGTITPGTNATATTVADQLKAILNG